MKKYLLLCLSILTVAGVGVVLSSCESDDPPPNPKVNFARATRTIAENAGSLEVEVTLDRALDKAVVISYDIDGSAQQGVDYTIPVDIGEVEIPAGSTSGMIEILITNDNIYEGNETIELRIFDTTNGVEIGEQDEITITITEDDGKPKANFKVTTMTVNEADGLLELEVELDAEAGQDIVVAYELSGTAIDSLTAWEESIASDYFIDGVAGEVEIPQGESTGTIRLQLYTDFELESLTVPETIIITLIENQNATPGTNKKLTINLKQQDGRIILLDWDPDYDEVDMDLFLWVNDLGGEPEDFFTIPGALWSTIPATEGPELVFLPDNLPQILSQGGTEDATFGASYTYWGGNESPMTFQVTFIDIVNGAAESVANRDNFEATYTLANINEWDNQTTGINPIIVQTFDKEDGVYKNVSGISVPAEGSRVRTGKFPANAQRKNTKRAVIY